MDTLGVLCQMVKQSNLKLIENISQTSKQKDEFIKEFLKPNYYSVRIVSYEKHQGVVFDIMEQYIDIRLCQNYFFTLKKQIDTYMEQALKHVYYNHYMGTQSLQKFINKRLYEPELKKQEFKLIRQDHDESKIDDTRCKARIWDHVNGVYHQCRKAPKSNVFCNIHITKRNYGIWGN